jgi:hypothetical protein
MNKKNRNIKPLITSFVTNTGKFKVSKLTGPVSQQFKNLEKISKSVLNSGLKSEHFHKASKSIHETHSLSEFGIKIGSSITAKILQQGLSSILNNDKSTVPFLSHNSNTILTKGNFKKTIVHIGQKPSSRLTAIRNNTNVDYDEKCLFDTELDFQNNSSRKILTLTSGFNEKVIGFFMHRTFLSAQQLLSIYNQNNRAEKRIIRNEEGLTNVYGCAYKIKSKLKLINRFKSYNVSITIHLIKITDISTDPRTLLEDVTSASVMGSSSVDWRDHNSSKINLEDQFTSPNQSTSKNGFLETFLTTLNCKLTDSAAFNNKAIIAESWRRTLTPASIWEFRLEHHLGKGIHINKLIDFNNNNNPQHPAGYFFIIECLGDPRGKIIRNKDKDFFQGYSPTKIHIEYVHKLCYLTELTKNNQDLPIFYTQKRNDQNFEEDSELDQIFTPNRKAKLHVAYDDISTAIEKRKKNVKFTLEDDDLDQSYDMMDEIVKAFKDGDLGSDGVTEDDAKFIGKINQRNLDLDGEEIEKEIEEHHNPPDIDLDEE